MTMSTANDNKKGTTNATTKSDSSKDQAPSSRKGMEQRDEKRPAASSKTSINQTKSDKDNETRNAKNK